MPWTSRRLACTSSSTRSPSEPDALERARVCVIDDHHVVSVGQWADEGQMRELLAQPAFEQGMAANSEVFAGPPDTDVAGQLTAVGPAREG